MYMLHTQKTVTTLVFHVLKYFQKIKLFVVILNLYTLHNTPKFWCSEYDTDGFNMHTGQPNPQSIISEYISVKVVINNLNNKFLFPALNISKNFATIDFNEHTSIQNLNVL